MNVSEKIEKKIRFSGHLSSLFKENSAAAKLVRELSDGKSCVHTQLWNVVDDRNLSLTAKNANKKLKKFGFIIEARRMYSSNVWLWRLKKL